MAAVRFGLFVPQGWIRDLVEIPEPIDKYEAMTRVAKAADQLGFDSIWLFDHFHTWPEPTIETTFECWTATAALARDTTKVRLGQMVTCNGYRNPALTAKMASTVDVLSHGRLDFGIGAGWYEHEYRAYGYDFPPTPGARLRLLEEALQVIRAMWTEPYATFNGEHYTVDGAINEPKPVQKPHPPIWVGGSGEKVTLRLAAQYGDATNFGAELDDIPEFSRKLDVVRAHCDAVGRDYDTLIHSTNLQTTPLRPGEDAAKACERFRHGESLEEYRRHAVVGSPQEIVDTVGRLIDAGANYVIFADVPGIASDPELVEILGTEVVPAFRG